MSDEKTVSASTSEAVSKYKPSSEFVQYLILAQSAHVESHELNWGAVNAQRDEVTKTIARRKAQSLGDIFEKLYIWRMESFDPSMEDFIYFDDLFPLSVYYDIKEMISFDGTSPEMDGYYERLLRKCKSRTDRKFDSDEKDVVRLFPDQTSGEG